MPEPDDACPPFRQDQYDMLMRCSESKDTGEWNGWRKANPEVSVQLACAELDGAILERVDLSDADLTDAGLSGANLKHANLFAADLTRADLGDAHMDGADLTMAILTEANLKRTHLEDAQLEAAEIQGAKVRDTHLEGADLREARLEGAEIGFAHLEGVTAIGATVDGTTGLWNCAVDKRTDFTGVGLAGANVEPGLQSVLERNVREIGWQRWYDESVLRKWATSVPVRAFWWVSDYGDSTARILLVFLLFSVAFAGVYYWRELSGCPGIVANLSSEAGQPLPPLLVPLRALYFSIVTMTTLGFGDMYANPQSYAGHVLLMGQVIVGYMLLGALITRFAVMFQGTVVPHVKGHRKGVRRNQ